MYYGFVYVWRDRWKNKLYVGSHFGTVTDGYICSSKQMLRAYRHRPSDFQRRIVYWLSENNRETLLAAEQLWLNLIEESELGVRFYNLSKGAFGGKISSQSKKLCGLASSKHWSDPANRAKQAEKHRGPWSEERRRAHGEKIRAKWADPEFRAVNSEVRRENGKKRGCPQMKGKCQFSEDTLANMSEAAKRRCTPEWSQRQGELMRSGRRSKSG